MKNVVLVLIFAAICCGLTLAEEGEKLQDVLPGTWNYTKSAPVREGPYKSITPTVITWEFHLDGGGVYTRIINQFNAPQTHEMTWTVKENTLIRDGDLKFPILEWSPSKMLLANPSRTTYFWLEKVDN